MTVDFSIEQIDALLAETKPTGIVLRKDPLHKERLTEMGDGWVDPIWYLSLLPETHTITLYRKESHAGNTFYEATIKNGMSDIVRFLYALREKTSGKFYIKKTALKKQITDSVIFCRNRLAEKPDDINSKAQLFARIDVLKSMSSL